MGYDHSRPTLSRSIAGHHPAPGMTLELVHLGGSEFALIKERFGRSIRAMVGLPHDGGHRLRHRPATHECS